MKKLIGLGALLLAGLLVIPGNLWTVGPVYAQEGSKQLTEQEYQELRKKRLEQWDDLEREDKRMQNTGQRLQEAEKRRQDALKRQKAAEQGSREMGK